MSQRSSNFQFDIKAAEVLEEKQRATALAAAEAAAAAQRAAEAVPPPLEEMTDAREVQRRKEMAHAAVPAATTALEAAQSAAEQGDAAMEEVPQSFLAPQVLAELCDVRGVVSPVAGSSFDQVFHQTN